MESTRCLSTKKNLISTVHCVERFRPGCLWVDVNYSFVHQFELWLYREGFAQNTVVKHLRNLRTFVNEAILLGHIGYEDNPFRVFKIPRPEVRHKYLSMDELVRIEDVCLEGRLGHIRDAFLFCCYTGLRFSDFCLLRQGAFYREGGYFWLRMRLKKTGVEVFLPLDLLFNGKAIGILDRYGSVEEFARIGSNSKVNSALKVLQKAVDIRLKLTFHVARHTCATLLCYMGVPITTVQRILGHTKVSTTQIYQEVMSETVVKDLKGANEFCCGDAYYQKLPQTNSFLA